MKTFSIKNKSLAVQTDYFSEVKKYEEEVLSKR